MNTMFEWYEEIALFAMIVFFIIKNIVSLYYFFKCIKVKQCYNRNCIYNKCCFQYKEVITKEEAEELERLIEALMKSKNS